MGSSRSSEDRWTPGQARADEAGEFTPPPTPLCRARTSTRLTAYSHCIEQRFMGRHTRFDCVQGLLGCSDWGTIGLYRTQSEPLGRLSTSSFQRPQFTFGRRWVPSCHVWRSRMAFNLFEIMVTRPHRTPFHALDNAIPFDLEFIACRSIGRQDMTNSILR